MSPLEETAAEESGPLGERLAARFLRKQGYRLLQANYRTRTGEVDLIARDGEEIVFIEVKTRSSPSRGSPAETVNPAKRRRLIRAAREFANRYRLRERTLRFDVLAVLVPPDGEPSITHFKDAFTPPPSAR